MIHTDFPCVTPLRDAGPRSTQLRGCPPPFGLLLYAAALSATPSCVRGVVGTCCEFSHCMSTQRIGQHCQLRICGSSDTRNLLHSTFHFFRSCEVQHQRGSAISLTSLKWSFQRDEYAVLIWVFWVHTVHTFDTGNGIPWKTYVVKFVLTEWCGYIFVHIRNAANRCFEAVQFEMRCKDIKQ